MLAAYSGHTEAVKMLIEAGADVNLQNKASYLSVCIMAVYSIDSHRIKRLPLCWLLEVDIQRQSRH